MTTRLGNGCSSVRRDEDKQGARRESDSPCEGHNLAPSPDGNAHHGGPGGTRTLTSRASTERSTFELPDHR